MTVLLWHADLVRCDSDDYGAVNPLFSSPALVRPSPLRAGPVAEGTEEGQDLHEALTGHNFLSHGSASSRQSRSTEQQWEQPRHVPDRANKRLWSSLAGWWHKPKSWLAMNSAADSSWQQNRGTAEIDAEPAEGRLGTDMITIDVPSSRCSSISHQSASLRQDDSEVDEAGLPLPPLSGSSSPTRRLTKQASDVAAAMILAISDASPIPRSPKPGPAPNRSWFVDVSPRRSMAQSLRVSPNAVHQLQPVSTAALRSCLQQLWQRHCLDLIVTVTLALLLGLLHGPAWQLQEIPAAALGATLGLGLLSLLAAIPVFAGVPAGGIVAPQCPWLHFLWTASLHAVMAMLRSAVFAAIYFSIVLPALPFGSLFLVLFLVSCWCTGLALLLARVLPVNQMAASSMAVVIALGASLNGVFPTLRGLHSTPWFLISGNHASALCSPQCACR